MSTSRTDPEPTRPLRSDAQRNYDALVETADAEFRAHGAAVPLEDIAARAKVGIATLYRHFPTRDDLLAKVLNDRSAAIVARAHVLLEGDTPGENLIQWIRELAAFATTYQGLTGALANSYVTEAGTRLCENCDATTAAGAALLARAQRAGEIRADAQVVEIILSAHSAAWVGEQTEDPGAASRLLNILFDGLRVVNRPKKKARAKRPARKSRGT